MEVIFVKRMLLRAICEASTVSEFKDNIDHLEPVLRARLQQLGLPRPLELQPPTQPGTPARGTAAPAC